MNGGQHRQSTVMDMCMRARTGTDTRIGECTGMRADMGVGRAYRRVRMQRERCVGARVGMCITSGPDEP